MPLLEVTNLRIALNTPHGVVQAVRGVDFSIAAGGTLGLIGESGCGKSLTSLALMGLLPDSAQVSGSIRLGSQELVGLDERALCNLRGNRMAMVFQEPMAALNPLHRIGHQVAEPLRVHKGLGRREALLQAQALLERVGINDAERRMGGYPHEFSGGQRQRIAIARALITRPRLIVADEPVSALDVSVQAQVLNLMQDLQQEFGITYMLISHDLAVVNHLCDEVVVLYQGRIVERGSPAELFRHAQHPYTQSLVGAVPQVQPGRARARRAAAAGVRTQ